MRAAWPRRPPLSRALLTENIAGKSLRPGGGQQAAAPPRTAQPRLGRKGRGLGRRLPRRWRGRVFPTSCVWWPHQPPPGWIVWRPLCGAGLCGCPRSCCQRRVGGVGSLSNSQEETALASIPRRRNRSCGQQQQPPPPRRVTNVGSLLLTPQENESLFTFLGKKCVVSGRDPHRRPNLSLRGPGGSAGKWEWGRRRERRGEGRTAGQVSLRPGSLGAGSAGRRPPPGPARGAGKCQVRRPVLEPVPLLLVQTLYSQASRESSCRSCLIVVTGLQDWPASPPTTPM